MVVKHVENIDTGQAPGGMARFGLLDDPQDGPAILDRFAF
jgi:hypothetical protein